MTRHDDSEWVSAERLPNGARRAGSGDSTRELTVRDGRTGKNLTRSQVDALVKPRNTSEIELDLEQVAPLPREQRRNCVDGALNSARRSRHDRMREPPRYTGACRQLSSFR